MRERPILFSGPMVRAILEGRKTQTRRVGKEKHFPASFHRRALAVGVAAALRELKFDLGFLPCPYGQPGDRLWVRETWRPLGPLSECTGPGDIRFGATADEAEWAISTWRPSIHMPRWASRIHLEITEVQVERLKDITEDDARAEGVRFDGRWWDGAPHAVKGTPKCHPSAREAFFDLWDSINGKSHPVEVSPWVWVVGFRRLVEVDRG